MIIEDHQCIAISPKTGHAYGRARNMLMWKWKEHRKEKQPEKGRSYKAKEDREMTQLDPLIVEGHKQLAKWGHLIIPKWSPEANCSFFGINLGEVWKVTNIALAPTKQIFTMTTDYTWSNHHCWGCLYIPTFPNTRGRKGQLRPDPCHQEFTTSELGDTLSSSPWSRVAEVSVGQWWKKWGGEKLS